MTKPVDYGKRIHTFQTTFNQYEKFEEAAQEVQYVFSAAEAVFGMIHNSIAMGYFDIDEVSNISVLCQRAMQHARENEGVTLDRLALWLKNSVRENAAKMNETERAAAEKSEGGTNAH